MKLLKNLKSKCVYFHINPIKQEIFYVGIGSKHRPYYSGKEKRSSFWNNEVNKYGYEIIIIHNNLNWKEACELETKYIKQVGRRDLGLGSLVNMTNGGEGHPGYKRSKETQDKINFSLQNKSKEEKSKTKIKQRLAGLKKRHTKESRKKMSEIKNGKTKTVETKLKMSLAKKGKPGNRKGKKASQKVRLKNSLSHLGQTAWNKGLTKELSESVKKCAEKRKGLSYGNQIVNQFDFKGNFITQWPSIKKASKELGISSSGITLCCKGKLKKTGGMFFQYNQ
jgi:hypothetical protein